MTEVKGTGDFERLKDDGRTESGMKNNDDRLNKPVSYGNEISDGHDEPENESVVEL